VHAGDFPIGVIREYAANLRHNRLMPNSGRFSLDDVTPQLRSFAEAHPEIQALFIFGSLASGAARETSDVDIAILLQDSVSNSIDMLLGYSLELEDLLKSAVDVVILNSAGPMLRSQIFRKGKMVYSRDVRRTRRFIGDALVEYYDEIVMLEKMQERAIRRLIGR